MEEYQRKIVETLSRRMGEPRRFMQILIGPRQTGKTTAIRQALGHVGVPYHYAEVPDRAQTGDWIRAHWQRARNLIRSKGAAALLAIDGVQLVRGWLDTVKALWDEDAWDVVGLRVVLTGSSAALLRTGLGDSPAGRFELIRCTRWTYAECREAFGYSLDDFLLFGGYPAAPARARRRAHDGRLRKRARGAAHGRLEAGASRGGRRRGVPAHAGRDGRLRGLLVARGAGRRTSWRPMAAT